MDEIHIDINNNKNSIAILDLYCQKQIRLKGGNMSISLSISDRLITQAQIKSKVFKRSISEQIEYRAFIGGGKS